MDQGVLKCLKLRYRRKLLRRLLIEDDRGGSMVDFLKGINMKKVAYLIAEAWNEIQPSTFRKSWQKILSIQSPTPKGESSVPIPFTTSHSVDETLRELFALCIEDNSDEEEVQSELPLTYSQPGAGSYAIYGV